MSYKIAVSLILLFTVLNAQTQTNNCPVNGLLNKLATGAINLNPNDIDTSSSTKDYIIDISAAKFEPILERIGFAFAISGFEGACSQPYYMLSVDKVQPQNSNTKLYVVVKFLSLDGNTITKWSKVSLTYIAVSRTFSDTNWGTNIWASWSDLYILTPPSGVTVPTTAPGAIDAQGLGFTGSPPAAAAGPCQAFNDPFLHLDDTTAGTCNLGTTAVTLTGSGPYTGTKNGIKIIHAYIMGFGWNPKTATSSTNYINIKIERASGAKTEDKWAIAYAAAPYGPKIYITADANLEYIKIGYVYSVLDVKTIPAATSGVSILSYSSSYAYELVKQPAFNIQTPLANHGGAGQSGYNAYYYQLPDAKYSIYGFSAITLPITSGTACTSISINATLNSINAYTVTSSNTDASASAIFNADIFTKNTATLCSDTAGSPPTITPLTFTGTLASVTPSNTNYWVSTAYPASLSLQTTYPKAIYSSVNVPNSADNTVFMKFGSSATATASTLTTMTAQTSFKTTTPGQPVQFQFGFYSTGATGNGLSALTTPINILVQSGGYILYQKSCTPSIATGNPGACDNIIGFGTGSGLPAAAGVTNNYAGATASSTTIPVTITVSWTTLATPVADELRAYISAGSFKYAYDPSTGCCVSSCPATNGLSDPILAIAPVCVACDSNRGMVYNPSTGSCACLSGYYLDTTKTNQCYPCTAVYCASCSAATPAVCTKCVTGAALDPVSNTCSCTTPGYYVSGSSCVACPLACATCLSVTGTCVTCNNDPIRDKANGCKCVAGYYDPGNSASCVACQSSCLTCTNANGCASCDPARFRTLVGSICTCIAGYYNFIQNDLTQSCQKCSPECMTCSISPATCSSCDPTKNRVAGVDSYGHQTCLCLPGFYSLPDGGCRQSDCNADPYCSQCEQGLKQCIQCMATVNRVISQPAGICVCADGYYQGPSKTCVACGNGCAKCTSATVCSACVSLATNNNDGTCSCPANTYFVVSADGVRYCNNCGPNCQTCTDSNTCTTCLPTYTKTSDNQCVCSLSTFPSTNGCQSCPTGCQICTGTSCQRCVDPLVLQGSNCVANCDDGFTLLGSQCVACPKNCLQCTGNAICYYCANGYYMINGNCVSSCPAGTIGDSVGNYQCLACNSPCATCINHPSYCTSCLAGKGYLQTSANNQNCVVSCGDGTFPSNGVCQVCDFSCAACLGSADNCIACPSGQILYNGGCWASCPAILFGGSICGNSCPSGYFNYSSTSCSACAPQCATCANTATFCTSCLNGALAYNGQCVISCQANQFSFKGICVACSSSCNGCFANPQNCISCAPGFVKSGSICTQSCYNNQYISPSTNACVSCDASCGSCSSTGACLTCSNPIVQPRNGICSACPYPCNTCSTYIGGCLTCLSGFSLLGNQCVSSCPPGSVPSNGTCVCSSGISINGQCTSSCPAGTFASKGSCQPCNQNCAACTGSASNCTQCVAGFSYNPSTYACTANSKCPYGQDTYNGVCTRICSQGSYFYQGMCVFGGCVTGYIDNGFGGCIKSTVTPISPSNGCPPNQFLLRNQCVAQCTPGFVPNSQTGNCDACPSNCVSCFSSSVCVTCQSNFKLVQGACVASSSCSSSQCYYGGNCLDSCPAGTFQQNGICIRSCPPSTYYYSNFCYTNSPTGIRTADAAVTSCPSNTTNQNGVCQ